MPPRTGSLSITFINSTISPPDSCACPELSFTIQMLPIFWNHETLKCLKFKRPPRLRHCWARKSILFTEVFKTDCLGEKGKEIHCLECQGQLKIHQLQWKSDINTPEIQLHHPYCVWMGFNPEIPGVIVLGRIVNAFHIKPLLSFQNQYFIYKYIAPILSCLDNY